MGMYVTRVKENLIYSNEISRKQSSILLLSKHFCILKYDVIWQHRMLLGNNWQ